MRSRSIAMFSLVPISLGLLWLAAPSPRDEETRRATGRPGAATDLVEVKRDLAALRSELAHLDRQVATPAAPEDLAPATPPANPIGPEERRQAALDVQRKAVAFLDARVGNEARDPEWTSQVQAELTASFEAGAGSAVRSVACGTTLCRAELTHPDKDHLDHFVTAVSGNLRSPFQLFYERDGDGLITTMYVAREGQQVPSFANQLRTARDGAPRPTRN